MSLDNPARHHDVIVLGGGLAGLTLAIQLRQQRPATTVLVLEKAAHPLPEAAHKVGESSVEVAAHYFGRVLGLREHLTQQQLPKYGLRFYFRPPDGGPIDQGLEVGPSKWPATPSFQLDRGRFETFLGERARELGVEFFDQARVEEVELGADGADHRVHYSRGGERRTAEGRWVVDAAGRAGLLKRRLGLTEPVAHEASAAWFRVDSRIDVDDLSTDPAWQAQGRTEGPRRLSTNHLMGEGYWVWLIPLASGSTSIGIVADPALHPLSTYNSLDRAMAWIDRHQPECGALIRSSLDGGAAVQDFLAVKHYSHSSKRVFSLDRWAITGDAGVFLDPFYSPGSDFIAMSNTFITDLVGKDLEGESIRSLVPFYERLYFSFFRNGLSLYEGMYSVWGNPRVMPEKVTWDYYFYWAIIGQLFFNGKLTDLQVLVKVHKDLEAVVALNVQMQRFFREWSEADRRPVPAGFVDQSANETLVELNRQLLEPADDDDFVTRLRANRSRLEAFADQIVVRAVAAEPDLRAIFSGAA